MSTSDCSLGGFILDQHLASATRNRENEHRMGTSIMAVTYAGGVVMGADSRTSTGSYIANRVSDKLTPVHDRIYCCRSGSAADTQAVSDVVRYYLDAHAQELGKAPLVKTAAHLFSDICYNNKDRLLASIICAGQSTQLKKTTHRHTSTHTQTDIEYHKAKRT